MFVGAVLGDRQGDLGHLDNLDELGGRVVKRSTNSLATIRKVVDDLSRAGHSAAGGRATRSCGNLRRGLQTEKANCRAGPSHRAVRSEGAGRVSQRAQPGRGRVGDT